MRFKYLLLLTTILLSCKPVFKDKQVENLYDEVIVIHDEVMPEISTINKLKKKIRQLPDQNPETMSLIQELDTADEAMMSWMSDFQTFRGMEKETKEVKLAYLESEKIKISNVSSLMKSAIAKAKKFVDEN